MRDVPVEVGVVGTPAPGFVVKGVPVADPTTGARARRRRARSWSCSTRAPTRST